MNNSDKNARSLQVLLEECAISNPTKQDLLVSQNELLAVSAYVLESLLQGEASSLMNSLVIGTHVPLGSRLLATKWVVDPAQAAFQYTLLMTWNGRVKAYYDGQDFLIVWASVLSMADYLSRKRFVRGQSVTSLKEVFHLMAQLRSLYVGMKNQWSEPLYNRWILKLLTGAACLFLMNKSLERILALWNHITLAGMGLPYPPGHPQESAWAKGLDQHQTIMAAYSVVQTQSLFGCEMGAAMEPTTCPAVSAVYLNPCSDNNEIQKELKEHIILAKNHPDLGRCEVLLELKNQALWNKGLSWLLTQCSLSGEML